MCVFLDFIILVLQLKVSKSPRARMTEDWNTRLLKLVPRSPFLKKIFLERAEEQEINIDVREKRGSVAFRMCPYHRDRTCNPCLYPDWE